MNIPIDQWKWYGLPGHFIGSAWCRFHLCTIVGDYIVSTVGQYIPPHASMSSKEFAELGANRTYETMVFLAGKPCDAPGCACGMPMQSSLTEVDFDGYNTALDATEGHYRMCHKWATAPPAEVQEEVEGAK